MGYLVQLVKIGWFQYRSFSYSMNRLCLDFFYLALSGFDFFEPEVRGRMVYFVFLLVFFQPLVAVFQRILSILRVSFYLLDYLLVQGLGNCYFLRNFDVNVDCETCILFYLMIYEPLLDFFRFDFNGACLRDSLVGLLLIFFDDIL